MSILSKISVGALASAAMMFVSGSAFAQGGGLTYVCTGKKGAAEYIVSAVGGAGLVYEVFVPNWGTYELRRTATDWMEGKDGIKFNPRTNQLIDNLNGNVAFDCTKF